MDGRVDEGNRERLLATIGISFALSGTALIVAALASRERAPPPPAAAAGTVGQPRSGFSINRASATVEVVLPRSQPVAVDIPAIDIIIVFAALVGSRETSSNVSRR